MVRGADGDLVEPVAPGWQLLLAAPAAIALLVALITLIKFDPVLALILGGLTVGIVAGENLNDELELGPPGLGLDNLVAVRGPWH